MPELQVNARVSKEKPNYDKTAAELLKRCREFYQDPENDKAFQAWKAEQKRKEGQ